MTSHSGTKNDNLDRHFAAWQHDVAELPHWLYQKRGWTVGMGNIHKMAQSNNDKLTQSVGKKLRQIRESHPFTISELAEHSGMAETDIVEFEEGKKRPDADQIIRLSQALNVVPSIFFTE